MHRRELVADGNAHAARLRRGIADDVAQPAHCLADRAIAGARGIGPRLAEAGDAHHDQARIDRAQLLIAQVPALHRAGPEIFDQDVAFANQVAHDLLAFRLAQVQRDRFLVARHHRPPERFSVGLLASPFAHRVAFARLLALDDFRAEIGKQLPAEWSGEKLAHLDHPKIGERPCACSPPRSSLPRFRQRALVFIGIVILQLSSLRMDTKFARSEDGACKFR